jgi:pyruvate kinase
VIYVDDGVLAFDVISVKDEKTLEVRCRNHGFISSKKGVNLPNTDIDLPALSEKDKADLRFGVENGVDMIFASFIRRGQDIRDIRQVLGEDGAQIKIIAKIENRQGLNNFADILRETVSWSPAATWVSRSPLPRCSTPRRRYVFEGSQRQG